MLSVDKCFRLAGAGLAAALTVAVGISTAVVPARAAQPRAFARSYAPTRQTFNTVPTTWNQGCVEWGVGPNAISFNTFELQDNARGVTRDIAVGQDGNLWISTDCMGTIVKLKPSGVATAYTYGVPSNCDETSTSITLGPDGNMWFVDQFADLVGKITTHGTITTYALPAAQPCNYFPSAPLGIVAGPDGAMWFTVTNPGNPFCQAQAGDAPAIGRITPAGAMTFYYTAPPGTTHVVSPERITAGPDGNLYFVASEPQNAPALALGQITTGGLIAYSQPFGTSANFDDTVTVGSDGNLWMSDVFDAMIFRITTSGVASGFKVGKYLGLQQAAYGIVSGPDGALWFTTSDDNSLGRITTAGRVSFHATPSCAPNNCGVGGGIVRRSGAVWNTLPGNRQIQDVLEARNLP